MKSPSINDVLDAGLQSLLASGEDESSTALGFCKSPSSRNVTTVFMGVSGDSPWYTVTGGDVTPLRHEALRGVLRAVQVKDYERGGKETPKLNLFFETGESDVVMLQTGVETNFAKYVLAALRKVEDLTEAVVVEPQIGRESKLGDTVLSRVFTEGDGGAEMVIASKEDVAPLEEAVTDLGERVGMDSGNIILSENL